MDKESELITRYRRLATAPVSDALDRLGIHGQVPGMLRASGSSVIVGRAFTVRYEPVGPNGGTVGDYIDDVDAGMVVVLANSGRTSGTIWGGLLSEVAAHRNVEATVIDGLCRDAARARELDYSLFSQGVWMQTGKDRVQAEAVQAPVSVAGIRVAPGDLIVADHDGVVCVPAGHEERIAAIAEEIVEIEEAIRLAAPDIGLAKARKKFGYFTLQRRE